MVKFSPELLFKGLVPCLFGSTDLKFDIRLLSAAFFRLFRAALAVAELWEKMRLSLDMAP